MFINDTSKPLIFLGSNSALYILSEVCEIVGIKIAGIVDKDYYGNTPSICDIPVIGSEDTFFDNVDNRTNYNFFCATNWIPIKHPVHERNKNKRIYLLELIQNFKLHCISIVDPSAKISKNATIEEGVFIDSYVRLEPKVHVGKFSNIMYNTLIGHHTKLGTNCVVQRCCVITGGCVLNDNLYVSVACKLLKPGATFGANTFIHEGIYLRRGTIENEIVSLSSHNQSRVIHQHIIE